DVPPGFGGAGPTDNVGGIADGEAFLVSAALLFPSEVGVGKFQPVVRYQEFDPKIGPTVKAYDVGVNYIIKGHNARLSLDWSHAEVSGFGDNDAVTLGAQLQF
ncbi:MAG: hypothetical protein ABW042_05805, partial [Phenylobacterium sp.]